MLVDVLVDILYDIVDDLDGMKGVNMVSNGEYISPHKTKDMIANIILMKLGYQSSSLSDLCRQGRAMEILQEVNKMQLPSTLPSRRILPSNRE